MKIKEFVERLVFGMSRKELREAEVRLAATKEASAAFLCKHVLRAGEGRPQLSNEKER